MLAIGAGLRLWQYFGRASLWLDELAVAENVLGRPLRTLLGEPLALDQVAPPGFLAAVKGATALLGGGELALRLFPFACTLAALPLFVAVARRMLDGNAAVFATALFALGVPFIAHGSEAKQYATDVCVALVLTLTALDLPEGAEGRPWLYWRAGLVGAVAVWFSQPAVFLLLGIGSGMAVARVLRGGRSALAPALPTLAVWATAVAASVAWSLHLLTPSTGAFMKHFWAGAFPDLSPRHRFGLAFLGTRLRDFWGVGAMHYPLPTLFVALMLLGLAALWTARREHALLLLGPSAAAFFAAAAHLYPFGSRFLLFLGPSFVLAAASGAAVVGEGLARVRVPRMGTACLLALPALLALAQNPPVVRHEEARPLFAHLARRRRPGDAIYLYYVAGRGTRRGAARAARPSALTTPGTRP